MYREIECETRAPPLLHHLGGVEGGLFCVWRLTIRPPPSPALGWGRRGAFLRWDHRHSGPSRLVPTSNAPEAVLVIVWHIDLSGTQDPQTRYWPVTRERVSASGHHRTAVRTSERGNVLLNESLWIHPHRTPLTISLLLLAWLRNTRRTHD